MDQGQAEERGKPSWLSKPDGCEAVQREVRRNVENCRFRASGTGCAEARPGWAASRAPGECCWRRDRAADERTDQHIPDPHLIRSVSLEATEGTWPAG